MGLLDVLQRIGGGVAEGINRFGQVQEDEALRNKLGPDFRGILASQIAEREMQDRTRTFVEQNARISAERAEAKQKEEQYQARIDAAERSNFPPGAIGDPDDDATLSEFQAGEVERRNLQREDDVKEATLQRGAVSDALTNQPEDLARDRESQELSVQGQRANVTSAEIRAKYGEQQTKQRIKLNADQIARSQDSTADESKAAVERRREGQRIYEANAGFHQDEFDLMARGQEGSPQAEGAFREVMGHMFALFGDDFDSWPPEIIAIMKARGSQ